MKQLRIPAVYMRGGTSKGVFFGIVRWKVKTGKPAFSADTADWSKGKFLTDMDNPNKGVLDAEVSPDGKRFLVMFL